MLDGLLIGLLIVNAFMLGLYAIICYINYRIVRKFNNNVSYLEMLIPLWNIFLIDRTALGKPYAYYYFWGSLIIVILLNEVMKNYSHDSIIMLASNIISVLIFAIPVVFIAQNLGKSIWVYSLLMTVPSLINFGIGFIITTIIILILAFDKSNPILLPDKEIRHDDGSSL